MIPEIEFNKLKYDMEEVREENLILTSKFHWPGAGPLPKRCVGDTSSPGRAHMPPTWPCVCPEVLCTPTPTTGMATQWAWGRCG